MEISNYDLQRMSPFAEIASRKIQFISDPELVSHSTPNIRLPDILKEGIMARRFAKRIGKKDYVSEWNDPQNEEYVSVTRAREAIFDINGIVIFIKTAKPVIPISNLEHSKGISKEFLIKHRVSPREFTGIGLSKRILDNDDFRDILYLCRITWTYRPEISIPLFEYYFDNPESHMHPGLSQGQNLRVLWPTINNIPPPR